MSNELATVNSSAVAISDVEMDAYAIAAITGDLSKLTHDQLKHAYVGLCRTMGLNPGAKPIDLLKLNGKLMWYVNRVGGDQLRNKHGVSITKVERAVDNGILTVTVYAVDKTGRSDMEIGAVHLGNLSGENLANAHMKALTKAKRRVTLSICGLGFIDDSEVDSIGGAQRMSIDVETGEIIGTSSVVVEDAPVRALPEVDHETQTAREGAWRLAESFGFTPQTHVKFFKHITGVHPRQASKAQADAVSAALDGLTEEQITSIADGAATIAEIMTND